MKITFLILILLTYLASGFHPAFGQAPRPIEQRKTDCDDNASIFWGNGKYFFNDKKIFIIGRLGTSEKSQKLNLSRIEAVVSKLTITPENKDAIPKDRIITAQGEPIGKFGIVEVYGDGYLLLVFEIKKNEQLKLGNCELEQ